MAIVLHPRDLFSFRFFIFFIVFSSRAVSRDQYPVRALRPRVLRGYAASRVIPSLACSLVQSPHSFAFKMKSLAIVASTLTLFANAQLSYNAGEKTIKCPKPSGTFCVGPASGLLVTCTNGVGAVSLCGGSATCSQTSPSSGDAACSATSQGSSGGSGPWVMDSGSEDCNCTKPSPPAASSKPVFPVVTPSSRWANVSTPSTTRSSTPVQPVVPSSTPCLTTSVPPVVPSSKSTYKSMGTGSAQHSSSATTLNSSWKPTLSPSSTQPSVTIPAPVQATGGAISGKSIHALALGLAGAVVALA
ncbi:uncharacterized protein PV09_01782 [Verruconis gallopava]|uniref:Uncharacterized protein n=1 Tax=Verruconis gallopava TaxID=253628 RepID=A0A0D2AM84_9PEZI|nr:uncharacterized protein PV09_01782 [Verruconis gallopava]KIW07868.1 hypothetical protein PV09_01782 [Verruconis gallopava]